MSQVLDVLFINPSNQIGIYQDLAGQYAAIEPPTWALLLAEGTRTRGWSVAILDTNAGNLSDNQAIARIRQMEPRLVVFVAYGQNVNSGTASMSGVVRLALAIKEGGFACPISVIGSYPQALPVKCLLEEQSLDFVFTNEGLYSLLEVLAVENLEEADLSNVPGLAIRSGDGVRLTPGSAVVPSDRLDKDLPGYAWDLLPFKLEPLDLYRSPYWHAAYRDEFRSPYAAIQTSLGCQFKCSFCMINILNRDDDATVGVASNYNGMRFWSPDHIVKQIDELVRLGVRTIRITDEMFLLHRRYYEPILETIAERDYASELRMWAYSRVDTITSPEQLELVRRAGIRWLCLGIESASRDVRLEISKGKFKDVDIRDVVEMVHAADIDVLANYIVGLPGEDESDMRKTLGLSLELCTSGWNVYAAMALPGSQLYVDALNRGSELPSTYEGFSFHSYESLPLASGPLTAADSLRFRDEAFLAYHSDPGVLDKIGRRFGKDAVEVVKVMTSKSLRRRILGD